jgi:hypothetical protein
LQLHAVDEVPVVVPIFNCEFNGQDLHSEPSEYKPVEQTQCVGDVEPVGAAENG